MDVQEDDEPTNAAVDNDRVVDDHDVVDDDDDDFATKASVDTRRSKLIGPNIA